MKNPVLKKVLQEDKAERIASYIINRIDDNKNVDIDYDWNLSKGKMLSGEVNTTFKMDCEKNTELEEVRNLFNSIEEVDEEDEDIINDFFSFIKDSIEKKNFHKMRDIIRKRVVGGAKKDIFPLDEIQVVNIEIGGKPEVDYVIVVQKAVPKSEIGMTDNYEVDGEKKKESVSQELMRICSKTGEDPNKVISRKKEEGDIKYKYVSDAYKKQYLFDCHVELYVDYSLGEMPEELKNGEK
jgi:hypothetical protein